MLSFVFTMTYPKILSWVFKTNSYFYVKNTFLKVMNNFLCIFSVSDSASDHTKVFGFKWSQALKKKKKGLKSSVLRYVVYTNKHPPLKLYAYLFYIKKNN